MMKRRGERLRPVPLTSLGFRLRLALSAGPRFRHAPDAHSFPIRHTGGASGSSPVRKVLTILLKPYAEHTSR